MSDQPQYPSYPEPTGQQPPPPPGYQPPPPPGYQPPPPGYQPPAYGQVPPAYGQHPGQPYGATPPYASWWSRVGASIIDGLIGFAIAIIPIVIGAILAFKDAETDPYTGDVTGGVDAGGIFVMIAGYALIFAFGIWNAVFRQGRTGQTLGKQAVGIQVVNQNTGQFLGAGGAFLRWLMMTLLGGLCLLNYLWPLWDAKKQTWHDMIADSVVIRK